MARRPGHEECWTCPTCGLSNCPDCDTEDRACPLDHAGMDQDPSTRRRRVRSWAEKQDQGSNIVEYGLLTAFVAVLALTSLALGGTVRFDVSSITHPPDVRRSAEP